MTDKMEQIKASFKSLDCCGQPLIIKSVYDVDTGSESLIIICTECKTAIEIKDIKKGVYPTGYTHNTHKTPTKV